MHSRKEHISSYLKKIKQANKELTKKEHFKDLLHHLYNGEKEIEAIINAISAGSERTILGSDLECMLSYKSCKKINYYFIKIHEMHRKT